MEYTFLDINITTIAFTIINLILWGAIIFFLYKYFKKKNSK